MFKRKFQHYIWIDWLRDGIYFNLYYRMGFHMVFAKSLIENIMDLQVRVANSINISFNIWSKFRGSPVSNEEKQRLNKLGGKILRKAGLVFEEWKDYNWITKGRSMFGTNNFGTEVTSAPNVNFGTKSKTKFGSRLYSSQKVDFGTKFEFRH